MALDLKELRRRRFASFAARRADLTGPGLSGPVSFRKEPAAGMAFNDEVEPLRRTERLSAGKTETERREEGLRYAQRLPAEKRRRAGYVGRGSEMVKKDRPKKELNKRDEDGPGRARFDQAWLSEQRCARTAEMRVKREAQSAASEVEQQRRGYARGYSR